MEEATKIEGDVGYLQLVRGNVYQLAAPEPKLSERQRARLNLRVRKVSETLGEPPWETWTRIHELCGVQSIEGISVDQLSKIGVVLDQLLDSARERTRCDRLIRQILQLSDKQQQAARTYSLKSFGTSKYKELVREELVAILCAIEEEPEREEECKPVVAQSIPLSISHQSNKLSRNMIWVAVAGLCVGFFIGLEFGWMM